MVDEWPAERRRLRRPNVGRRLEEIPMMERCVSLNGGQLSTTLGN